MRNKNGKRATVQPSAATESVVAKRRSSPSNSTSSLRSCLSTTEERKEEVASSGDVEDPTVLIAAGCRRCYMYVMVMQGRQRCPKCKSTDLIQIT
ncbi:hypothetical protein AALP_AA5G154500 [Arabis alpina]|uniref:GIR1-like zinc ribbon domain-containing protein n=1 Tax=Arabis alpina TaxID=50452 RepID=A0A087GXA6_ARAAL|nr:hypothetical protein AALP_AA5G154500 [Arabis alpina]